LDQIGGSKVQYIKMGSGELDSKERFEWLKKWEFRKE